ncbi:MAG: NAD(P)/FAD-dependent oxidoreductase [Paracoccaceae bacterium]
MERDFLVIGGGIAGISAAARLSDLGSVTLIEAEAGLGFHASGRSAAMFEPYYGKPPVVALSLAGDEHLRRGGFLTERGLMIISDGSDDALFDAQVAAFHLDEITVGEARGIVPILDPAKVRRAAMAMNAWDVDTDRLIQDYLRAAKANHAEVVTGAPATAIRRGGAGWVAATPKGEFGGRVLVNAAGPWADRVAAMAGVATLGFTPLRRSMARIPAPGGHDVSRWPMVFGAGETWYCKPDAGALIVSPAEEDPMEPHDAWADDMVLAEGLARYEAMVTEPVTRLLSSWAGLRTFSPDRVLVIGRDPVVPSFFWLAGQGGYGFQTAPGASRLAADLLAGRVPEFGAEVVAALSPARFAD